MCFAGKRAAENEDAEVGKKCMRVINPPFERAVFIDCTWNQTRNIMQDERLKGIHMLDWLPYSSRLICLRSAVVLKLFDPHKKCIINVFQIFGGDSVAGKNVMRMPDVFY